MAGSVDGLKMNELFSNLQVVPALSLSTAAAGNHLATIDTTMLTNVTGLTSKAAANHANTNREETIDYKDMPTNV